MRTWVFGTQTGLRGDYPIRCISRLYGSLEGVVGGERVYALTDLNLAHGGLHVRISENFDAWTVTPVPRR